MTERLAAPITRAVVRRADEADTTASRRDRNTEVLTFDGDKMKRVEFYFRWNLEE
jgi:hypothetical protein